MYLNCHSHFSFKYGSFSPEELLRLAVEKGITRLALTDINNTSGIFDFVDFCLRTHVHPVAGIEFRNGFRLCYIGLAENADGFEALNRFLSQYLKDEIPFLPEAPELPAVQWIYPPENLPARLPRETEWLGIKASGLRRWQFRKPAGEEWQQKALAWQPVSFPDRRGFDLHRLLRCMAQNELLGRLRPETHAAMDEFFPSPEEMLHNFREAPELIFRAEALLERCSFAFNFEQPKNKRLFSADRSDDLELLRKLAEDGLEFRYGRKNTQARKRVEKELGIIHQLDFTAYFLITWDIIRYARSRGFFHVGRGSGANSMVAYCLGITDVDPIELDLYFERFINPHRSSPPDFDIDFSWDEREDIQTYIFRRYGREHVAMLGAYVTYQRNSILRELGKVFGLPSEEIDRMGENPAAFTGSRVMQWIERFGGMMKDMPSHVSIHAGGILISEESMFRYTALHLPPKGFPTTQFDMYVAEDIGFAKFDILSQRGLGHIKDAVDIIYENKGLHVDVHAVQRFKQDERIRKQIRSAETIGCFYIESPAMRQLLHKLRCEDYITLVAASSIIRPGVSRSGMMREYINRFHRPGSFRYIHPDLEPLLKETYGVMVYQEDVIKVAHFFAGLDLADADTLRRGMSGKFRSKAEFAKIREKFFDSCARKGYSPEITSEVWRQMESFSGYSFSKAHSASFAVESYQSLFLKTYYPMEFMVAVINNFGGFYRTEIYVHEARRSGARVEAPCVNHSRVLTRIKDDCIYLGFIHLQGLESKLAESIENEREEEGRFRSLEQFLQRVRPGLEQAVLLVRCGAFRFTGRSRKELLWDVHVWYNGSAARQEATHASLPIFSVSEEDATYSQELSLPGLSDDSLLENAYDELELLGFSLSSPFALCDWKEEFERLPDEVRNAALPEEKENTFGRRQLQETEVQKRIAVKNSENHG